MRHLLSSGDTLCLICPRIDCKRQQRLPLKTTAAPGTGALVNVQKRVHARLFPVE